MTPSQADRDTAADLIETYWQGAGEGHDQMRLLAQSYRNGHTQGVWAAAFAAHRCAALEEAIAIALDEVRLGYEGYDLTGFYGENTRCRAIAARIRALIDKEAT